MTAITALATFPLYAEDDYAVKDNEDRKATSATEVIDSADEEKIAWGKETNGLVANLRSLKKVVKPGEPIEFEIRVKNVSEKEIHLLGYKKPSPSTWSFHFGEWEWRPLALSLPSVPLKPGATADVRCLMATTRDSLTAEQKRRFLTNNGSGVASFRNVKNKKESVRLPAGVYRVRAATRGFSGSDRSDRNATLETNTIEVRILDRR